MILPFQRMKCYQRTNRSSYHAFLCVNADNESRNSGPSNNLNDCLDAQEAESREDSFMGRFRLMLREELNAAGNAASFQPIYEIPQPSQENAEQTLAFLDAFDGME